MPEGGVLFQGPVTLQDAIESVSFRKQRSKFIRQNMLLLFLLGCFFYFIGWFASSYFLGLFAAVAGTGCITIVLFKRMRGHWRLDQVVVNSRGWISSEGIEFGISFGRVFYEWSGVQKLEVTDKAMSIQLSGYWGHHLLFSKSQFKDIEAWNDGVEIARRNCPQH